jgi:DNA repair exonuclease SbcCD ATPase subunit
LKNESKKVKQLLENSIGRISSLETSIQTSQDEMSALSDEIIEESKNKVEFLKQSLTKFESLRGHHNQQIVKFKAEEEAFKKTLQESSTLSASCKLQIRDLEKKLNLYQHDKCPTCESDLKSEFHNDMKEGISQEKQSAESQLEVIEKKLVDLTEDEITINEKKAELIEKGTKIKSKIETIQEQIKELNKTSEDKQTAALQRLVENLQSDLDLLNSEKFKTEEKITWLKTIDDVLGEKGVKQMAIKTILPSLNSEILELLHQMNLNYRVIFDEEFNASIYHMGIEISSQTLSTGEMKKVDFVVLIAIMKLMKMKFSNINLLFLDELFSSVDPDGVYSIVKILKQSSKELGLNIFVINHAPMPHEIFDWKIDITKTNNFSSLLIDKF